MCIRQPLWLETSAKLTPPHLRGVEQLPIEKGRDNFDPLSRSAAIQGYSRTEQRCELRPRPNFGCWTAIDGEVRRSDSCGACAGL
jgi:hypothetical protein